LTDSGARDELSSSANHFKHIRIVIADDLPEMLAVIEQRLAAEYVIVGKATNGLALVESVCSLQPDVLVTDISMPRLTGIEALRRLRKLGVKTPAVILTIHEDEDLAREALRLGALGFVLKSRLEDDLRKAIDEALAGRTFLSERLRQKLEAGASQECLARRRPGSFPREFS
jgi:DNA-binding NarL/FixJ family response regulator